MRKIYLLSLSIFVGVVLGGCNLEPANNSSISTEETVTTAIESSAVDETSEEYTTEEPSTEEPSTEETTTEIETTEPETTEPETTESPLPDNYLIQDPPMEDADVSEVLIQYEENKEDIARKNEALAAKYKIPVIHITTLDNKTIKSTDYYVPSVVDVFNCDEEYVLTASAGVRLRGNSTSNGWNEEKPYRIKFTSKQNMLGLHDGAKYKSWVLLMAQWNVAMDYTGFNLANVVLDDYIYSSDCTYVIVYINDKYCGLHVLCEQNQVAEGRVEVLEENLQTTEPMAPDKMGYFLEIDNNSDDGHPCFNLDYDEVEITDYAGVTRTMDDENITIKSDILTVEQYNFIYSYTENIYRILYKACVEDVPMMFDEDYNLVSAEGVYTSEEAVRAVIDVDSFVNMTLLYELIQDYDIGAGSFYFAVDFSENSKYPKFTCTAPWDFNWAYGENPDKNFYACTWQKLQSDKWDRSNIWLITPMLAPWYQELVACRWKELSESGVLSVVLDDITTTVKSFDAEYGDQPWKVDGAINVVEYVRKRIKFLDKQFINT